MKIEIKPGDQSLCGKKLFFGPTPGVFPDDWVEILYVGEKAFLGRDYHGREIALTFHPGQQWLLCKEPKQKKLMALAICGRNGEYHCFSNELFSSESDARKKCMDFHSWPAIPNAQGFYEVEE